MRIDEIIYKTLIAGDSYRTLLKGLWVTFQISLLSLLLGTLLGVAAVVAAGFAAIENGKKILL